jgi:hypothetical protein
MNERPDFLAAGQGSAKESFKMLSTDEILTLGVLPPARERPEWLKDRIIGVVAEGVRRRSFYEDDPVEWRHRPGLMNWWVARQLVGGKVSTEDFNTAVDALILDGRLVEVWLVRPDQRAAPHMLVRPGKFAKLPRPVAQARGRAEVLAGEPWAQALLDKAARSVR